MFKAMILLKRKEGLSFADFKHWWMTRHVPLARQLPGLKKGVVNIAAGDGDGDFDGVSELWFETEQQFIDAYASDMGQKVAADSLSMVSRRERLFVHENQFFPD